MLTDTLDTGKVIEGSVKVYQVTVASNGSDSNASQTSERLIIDGPLEN